VRGSPSARDGHLLPDLWSNLPPADKRFIHALLSLVSKEIRVLSDGDSDREQRIKQAICCYLATAPFERVLDTLGLPTEAKVMEITVLVNGVEVVRSEWDPFFRNLWDSIQTGVQAALFEQEVQEALWSS
jgi:hypothetical protein